MSLESYYKVASYDVVSLADAIRAKGGTSEPMIWPSGFISAVSDISGVAVLESLSVSQNGYYSPSSGVDGFSDVVVDVQGGGDSDPLNLKENFKCEFSYISSAYRYTFAAAYDPDLNSGSTKPKVDVKDTDFPISVSNLLQEILNPHTAYMEYTGYVTQQIIEDFNLVLLADAHSNTSNEITLSDSIDNYDVIVIVGAYAGQIESGYNTTIFYADVRTGVVYYATMKDRHGASSTGVEFTSGTTATLTGTKKAMIYGIPKSS
jgi:hypothetical protein